MKIRFKLLTIGFSILVVPTMTFSANPNKANTDASKSKPAATAVQQPVTPAEQPKSTQLSSGAMNPASGEQIKWQVLSGGGGASGSTNFKLLGTVSQTAVGLGTSTNFKLNAGFWQDFGETGPCDCIPGDANNSKNHNILDVSYLIGYLYRGGPAPTPYAKCSGDANCNCGINILDVSYLINYLYRGGTAPCTCTQWVGTCGPLQK